MKFTTWEPVYDAIIESFGFDRAADERARDVLAALTSPFSFDTFDLPEDPTVAIVGAGPSLEHAGELARVTEDDVDAIFAASTAVDVLEDQGIAVDCMVTDLDKNPETVVELTARGTPVAVHAHGDNIPAVRSIVPDCSASALLPTTQAEPVGPVCNVGGFTDGDRAAFLADHLGASTLRFVGWDFDDPTVEPMKAQKLEWAERLLYWLEHRRGDRFGILDDRRSKIDTTALPLE